MGGVDLGRIGECFEEHAFALLLYARHFVGDELAKDAVQDVFVQLIRLQHPPREIKAWLFAATRNRCISLLRSRQRRRRRETTVVHERATWFKSQTEDLLDAQTITQKLQALDKAQREVIVMRIWGELTLQQIADIVGCSIKTVFHRYESGLQNIRKKLEQSCITKRQPKD